MRSQHQNPRLAQIRAAAKRHREDLALVQAVSQAANESVKLNAVLAEVTEMICEHMNWQLGHALSVEGGADGRPRRMLSLGIWYLEDRRTLARFKVDTEAQSNPGVVQRLFSEHTPIVFAVADEPRFERREVALAVGLAYYHALPIVSGDEVVAALEFMSAEPTPRSPEHLQLLLTNIGTTLGRVAEREAREQEHVVLVRTEIARDEAEQQVTELQRLTRELRRRNRELDQFAYVASHDLRAPLRGIANLAGWLANDLDPHLTDETRRYLELLQGRVKRMEALINGLLEYSRVGRKATPEQDIEVEALVREIADLLDPGDEVVWVFGELPTVRGQRLLLRQVFDNLMSNAIKYAIVEQPRVEIGAVREHTGSWRFFVRDNGPGIAPHHHDRIWEIFQILQPRDEVEGTGIGLSLVRKIVEQRGGEVGIESTPGGGATFTFTWPDHAGRETSDVHDVPQGF